MANRFEPIWRRWQRFFTLPVRIYGMAGLLVLLVIGSMMITLHAQRRVDGLAKDLATQRVFALRSFHHLKFLLAAHKAAVYRFAATKSAEAKIEADKFRTAIETQQDVVSNIDLPRELRSSFRRLERALPQYFLQSERAIEGHPANLQKPYGEAIQFANHILIYNRDEIARASERVSHLTQRHRRVLLSTGFATALLAGLIAYALAASLLRPLRELLKGVRSVASGRLDVALPVDRRDDLGQIATAFNLMTFVVREQTQKLMLESLIDPLTGAFNRRFFERALQQEVERARRSRGEVCLLLADIDHFKDYNDRYGHEFGNEVLRTVCQTIRENLREIDTLVRYGGDELAMILPSTSAQKAKALAKRVLEAVAQLELPTGGQGTARLTLSVGGASFPHEAAGVDDLLAKADEALYAAKRAGRNRLHWSWAAA